MAHPSLSFSPTFLVFGNAGSLFEVYSQFIGLRIDDTAHHTLFYDRIAAWPEASAKKYVGNISSTATRIVEEILRLPGSGRLALD